MSGQIVVVTDNKWHNFKYGYELLKKWRREFDYMTDEEYESNLFIKYRGWVTAVNEFQRIPHGTVFGNQRWSGYLNDTFFSGLVIRISSDGERYKIGRWYVKGA